MILLSVGLGSFILSVFNNKTSSIQYSINMFFFLFAQRHLEAYSVAGTFDSIGSGRPDSVPHAPHRPLRSIARAPVVDH